MDAGISEINALQCTDQAFHIVVTLHPKPSASWIRLFNEECMKKGLPDLEWCEAQVEPRFHVKSTFNGIDGKMDALDRVIASTNEKLESLGDQGTSSRAAEGEVLMERATAAARIQARLRERYGLG